MYRYYSDYYLPSTKAGLLKILLPTWKGSKTELREYSKKRLMAVFHATRQKKLDQLFKKENTIEQTNNSNIKRQRDAFKKTMPNVPRETSLDGRYKI